MTGDRVHADGNVVPALKPGLGRARSARLWVLVRNDPPFAGPDLAAAFCRYTPDRKGGHPQAHLSKFRGILEVDGYAGFAKLYARRRCSYETAAHTSIIRPPNAPCA